MPAVKKIRIIDSMRRTDIENSLKQSKRLDGRTLLDYREISIETNVLQKTCGSASVKIGDSEVLAGIKVELGRPFPDTPDKGIIICNAELLPICSAFIEPGPPSEDAIELSRVSDRGIRESGMIDLSQLVIRKGEDVFAVFIDVAIINEDGNLFDACSYAIAAALHGATMPTYKIENDKVVILEEVKPLPILSLPISTTFVKIGDKILLDPNAEEQTMCEARLTLVTDDKGNYVSAQKGKAGGFSFKEFNEMIEISKKKGEEIRKKIIKSDK
jgi:exosome complex component RRP42